MCCKMNLLGHTKAWDEYLYLQEQDKKTLKRINILLKDLCRNNGNSTIGKVEKLKYSKQGLSSIRIDKKNRIVFFINNGNLNILSCLGHYD